MKFVMEGKIECAICIAIEVLTWFCVFFRIILDADPASIVQRVALRTDDIPIGEQTVAQVTNAVHNFFW